MGLIRVSTKKYFFIEKILYMSILGLKMAHFGISSQIIFLKTLEGCRKICVGCSVALHQKIYFIGFFIYFNLRSKTVHIGSKARNSDILYDFFLKNILRS